MSQAAHKEIGERIRMYRKIQGIKLEDLAKQLYKSKSTVSKYENGEIAMTIDVLLDIAHLLDVSPEQLIAFKKKPSKRTIALGDGFFNTGFYYVYYVSDCHDRIIRGVLDIQSPLDGQISAFYYAGIPSFEDYKNCQYLYYGELEPYSNYACFIGNNHINKAEKLFMNISTPFTTDSLARGIICGLSVIFRSPMAFKCVVSKQILKETDDLWSELLISKDDLQMIKKYNALIRNDTW